MIQNIITKDIIFSQTTAENIYLKYLNLPSFPTGNISSPFSDDKNPSFTLYKNGTFKCNSSTKQGDVFQFVAYVKQLDNKTQFNEVLNDIATEMNINQQPVAEKTKDYPKTSKNNTNVVAEKLQPIEKPVATESNILLQPSEKTSKTNINNIITEQKPVATIVDEKEQPIAPKKLNVSIRDFTKLDLEYWSNLGVEKSILDKFKVHSISESGFEQNKMFKTKANTVSFAYEINGLFKKYTPEQPEQNIKKSLIPHLKDLIFGLEQLPAEKIENLIICEGEKDVIIAGSRGFNAVTFGSATNNPTPKNIKLLQVRCKNLFVCYDADPGGETGAKNIIKNYPEIINLQLPKNDNIKGYDITDYFQEHTAHDFQKIIDLAVKNKLVVEVTKIENPTIFHIVEDYLNKNYDFRFNEIALDIEVSIKSLNLWDICNENSLWIELQKKNIKVGLNALVAILKSDFVPKYNPIKKYFENLPIWNKENDYITQYSQYINLAQNEDKEQFEYHFKKWCVRAVKCVMINDYFNKQAFVLSDDGKSQNAGKTSWINFLCPESLQNYIKMDLPKDEKDAKISLAKNFFINLDELANLSKQDVNGLKSLFSTPKIKVRLPYDKKDTTIQRICSFIGSTNNSTFLSDETGSVRWLCFVLENINWKYRDDFKVDNLWSQAFYLSNDNSFDETFTKDDLVINEIRNEKFQNVTPEKEMIIKYFEKPTANNKGERMTATEIFNFINGLCTIRLNSINIGKALTSLKYEKIKTAQSQFYLIVKKEYIVN